MSATDYVKVYKGKDGWRWHRMVSSDITSESGEAYTTLEAAYEAACKQAPDGVEVWVEGRDDAA